MSLARARWFLSLSVFGIVLFGSAAVLRGQAGSESKEDSGPTIQNVILEGELLSQGKGSGEKRMREYSLKVMRAVNENGEELRSLQGQILRFRDTGKSRGLIQDHSHGDKVGIQGSLNLKTHEVDVQSFKSAESGGSTTKPARGSESK